MNFRKKLLFPILVLSLGFTQFSGVSRAEQDTTATNSIDSVNIHLKNANKALNEQDQNVAINELLKAIKEQQAIIEKMQSNQSNMQSPQVNYSNSTDSRQNENPGFFKQLTNALPFIGGQYGDAEDQWRKAYKLQHKAVFDLGRREAEPVFEDAIKEYRILVENYPTSKRAPQAQRQIAWIYQSQLHKPDEARIEWSKLIQLYPNCEYAGEAKSELRELEAEARK